MISAKEIIIRLLIASALGALVGLERERKDWAAGLRTHMIVCIGSCLVIIVSAYGFQDVLGTPHVVLDPSRIAAQVISGIGFLGAGTILFLRQEVVRGLTTAAGLWTVAAIGLAVGSGMYLAACVTTLIVFVTLAFLKPFKKMIFSRDKYIRLKIENQEGLLNDIYETLSTEKELLQVNIQYDKKANEDTVQVYFNKNLPQKSLLALIDKLKNISGIKHVSYTGK